ncbi:hypothetical protein SFRURICE_008947 [Spodoptera frugiperda]|nr:hypothetical protein SFRURICE_008947 [Spodoptera frugiperda]
MKKSGCILYGDITYLNMHLSLEDGENEQPHFTYPFGNKWCNDIDDIGILIDILLMKCDCLQGVRLPGKRSGGENHPMTSLARAKREGVSDSY